ncbi:MAG: sugar phosphate isomerase/epimerase [Clostridia bacterium]|nr:sugar phosphate isomerase/epimerase [Clostridia bacterium]
MIYGMPTLIETNEIQDCAKLCRDLGLSFVELNMNLPQYQHDKIDVDLFNALAGKYGITYSIHLDENTNVSDFNPYISKAYLRTVEDTIEIAKRLNARIINMHMSKGVYFTLPSGRVYLFEKYLDKYLDSIAVFRNICEKVIGESDVLICIENSNGYENFQIKALEILLRSRAFGLTFDIGHNYAIGGSDEEFIMNNINKLRHFHIHDATRERDHLVLGEGEINVPKYIDLAKRLDASAVIETKTVDSLKKSCDIIKTI